MSICFYCFGLNRRQRSVLHKFLNVLGSRRKTCLKVLCPWEDLDLSAEARMFLCYKSILPLWSKDIDIYIINVILSYMQIYIYICIIAAGLNSIHFGIWLKSAMRLRALRGTVPAMHIPHTPSVGDHMGRSVKKFPIKHLSDWWFGTWLLFVHLLGRIIPTD